MVAFGFFIRILGMTAQAKVERVGLLKNCLVGIKKLKLPRKFYDFGIVVFYLALLFLPGDEWQNARV